MGFIVFLIVGGAIVYSFIQKGKEKQAMWREAAERLGLGYFPGDLGAIGKISGSKGGHMVDIETYSRTHNNTTSTYTRYKVRYHNPIHTDFRIVRQNALHKTEAFYGLQDIEVGDRAFDDRVLIRGKHPDRIIKFLTPERRRAIVELIESYMDVEITNTIMELNKSGKDSSPHTIYNTANVMLSVANDLTDNAPSVAENERILEMDEAPSATPILTVEKEPDPFFPKNPLVKETPGEDFVESWGVAEKEPAVVEVEDVESGIVHIPESEIEDHEISEDPVPESKPVIAAGPVSLQSIAEHLYSGGADISLKSGPTFQEHYENRTVHGEGTLKRVGKFSYDPIFPNTKGVKAAYDICTLAGPYSKIKVVAYVMYPVERLEELQAKIGTTLPITGKLVGQNSILTQLYIVHEG